MEIVFNIKEPYVLDDFVGANNYETIRNLKTAIIDGRKYAVTSPHARDGYLDGRRNFALWECRNWPEKIKVTRGRRRGYEAVIFDL